MKEALWKLMLTGLLSILDLPVYSQLSYGGRPYYYLNKMASWDEFIEMPDIDLALLKDSQIQQASGLKSLRFAHPFKVNISPEYSGKWEVLEDESRLWRVGIRSQRAYSLNLIFSTFQLNEGAKLFIYKPDMTVIHGAYDYRNNLPHGGLATSPIPGDEIVVELQVSKNLSDYGSLVIGQVSHDYKGIFRYLPLKDGNFGRSDTCNIDINCAEGDNWQNEKRAVARIIVNGVKLCTGSLVNTTSDNSIPYFLTANHCIADSSSALHTVFCFHYESPYCDGPDGSIINSISGSLLRATSANLDFTLVELIDKPPYTFDIYYAGWSAEDIIPDSTVSIHHPQGDVKKISMDRDSPVTATYPDLSYDTNGHWQILEWNAGTTEGGSSGSPLFDQNHRIAGSLTGGEANCINPVNDYYAKIARDWDDYAPIGQQLKNWLDPLNTGHIQTNAYLPGSTTVFASSILKNTSTIEIFDTITFYDNSVGTIALYKWNFGSGATPQYAFTEGPHKVVYNTTGQKTITLEIINGQKSSTSTVNIMAEPVGIIDSQILENIIYPNPSHGMVYIEKGDSQDNCLITVYNILGQEIFPSIGQNESSFYIDFNHQAKGIYIIRMNNLTTDKIKRFPIIIQ